MQPEKFTKNDIAILQDAVNDYALGHYEHMGTHLAKLGAKCVGKEQIDLV